MRSSQDHRPTDRGGTVSVGRLVVVSEFRRDFGPGAAGRIAGCGDHVFRRPGRDIHTSGRKLKL